MPLPFRTRGRTGLLSLAVAMAVIPLHADAQGVSTRFGQDQEIDLALTYTTAHSNHTSGPTLWLQGGGLTMNAQFYRGVGLMASGTGLHSSGNSSSSPLDLFTIAFGPSYTARLGTRVSVFGEALLGEAHGFHSLFSYGSGPLPSLTAGTTDSANALAFQTGGGIDLHLTPHLAIRPVEVEYLRTQLPNGGTDLQNNLRIAAGLVATFGGVRHHDAH